MKKKKRKMHEKIVQMLKDTEKVEIREKNVFIDNIDNGIDLLYLASLSV